MAAGRMKVVRGSFVDATFLKNRPARLQKQLLQRRCC